MPALRLLPDGATRSRASNSLPEQLERAGARSSPSHGADSIKIPSAKQRKPHRPAPQPARRAFFFRQSPQMP